MTGAFMASIAIKATVILALGLGAHRLLRRSRAAVRHLLLLAVCATVLMLPVAALVLPVVAIPVPYAVPVSVAPVVLALPAGVAFTPVPADVVAQSATAPSNVVSIARLVLIVEMLGATLALLPVIAGMWQTRRLRAAARPWPGGQKRIDRLAAEIGIRRRMDVLVHDDLPGPVTYRLWRPVLLFPADAEHWDDKDVERAAIHEIEHVRRHDWATDCFARIVCALYWFHPLIWVTWRQLRLESERAADDAVVRAREGTAYADLLVTLAERLVAGQRHYGLAMASRRDLPLRIQALLDASLPRGRAGRGCIVLTVLLTASAILGVAPLRARAEVRTTAIEQGPSARSMVPTQTIQPPPEAIATRRVPDPLAAQQTAPPIPPAPVATQEAAPPPPPPPPAAQQAVPPAGAALPATDQRLYVLFFDLASIDADALSRARAVALQFVNETMTNADLMAIITNGTGVRVVQDFTASRGELRTALESPGVLNDMAPDVSTLAGKPLSQTADAAMLSDVPLRALTTLCGMLTPFEQRKTVLYFSSGMNMTGSAVRAELRAATSACHRANVSLFPLDVRGFGFTVTRFF